MLCLSEDARFPGKGSEAVMVAQGAQKLSATRAWNIALRTAHIGVTGALFGGHVFGAGTERLIPWLYLAILTGGILALIEAYPNWRWCYEIRAAAVFAKVLLLCLIPWFWDYRIPILAAVIVIASVGSHMPRWFRHYSLAERRVMVDAGGAHSPHRADLEN